MIIVATVASCENGIFTQSTTKMLTTEWVLTGGTQGIGDTISPRDEVYTKDSVEITFHDGTMTVPYFETLEFNKDYTYTSNQGYDFYNGFETYTIDGTWELLSAEGKYEDEERVLLTPEILTETFPGNVTHTNPLDEDYTFSFVLIITKLTKDEFNYDFVNTIEDYSGEHQTTGSKKFVEK